MNSPYVRKYVEDREITAWFLLDLSPSMDFGTVQGMNLKRTMLIDFVTSMARLLTRHWLITDGNGKVEEVRGDGVVGEQPYLKPGQGFRYSSGAVIETPVGFMQGSYQMLGDDGAHFDAPIEPFRLAMPGILQ